MMGQKGDWKNVAASIALGLVLGCAGRDLTKVGGTNDLPKDLPKELADKFEIRETLPMASTPTPAATSSVINAALLTTPGETPTTPQSKSVGKKKTKAGPIASVTPSAQGKPFVYPNRRPAKDPIWIGEQQVFEITYFGMAAGTLTVDVLPYKSVANRKVYHLKGTALSSKVFSLFYSLNDYVESFFDYEGLFSHRFHLVLDETKQTRDALELNDSEKGQTYYWNRWNHKDRGFSETKEFGEIQAFSQDSMSALFYLRTLDLPDGKVVTVPVVSEGKTWEAVVTVLRREVIDSPMGRVRTIVLKPETKFQGVLQKKGDSFIWVTDDDRRFVVRLEAKVKIGTVIADLKKVELGEPPAAPSGEPPAVTTRSAF